MAPNVKRELTTTAPVAFLPSQCMAYYKVAMGLFNQTIGHRYYDTIYKAELLNQLTSYRCHSYTHSQSQSVTVTVTVFINFNKEW